jgi:hypothetical protein
MVVGIVSSIYMFFSLMFLRPFLKCRAIILVMLSLEDLEFIFTTTSLFYDSPSLMIVFALFRVKFFSCQIFLILWIINLRLGVMFLLLNTYQLFARLLSVAGFTKSNPSGTRQMSTLPSVF